MNSNKLWMTAQIPSGFGMPISGHAFGDRARRVVARRPSCASACTVIAGVKAPPRRHLGLTQSYFPGTTAWRPPTC